MSRLPTEPDSQLVVSLAHSAFLCKEMNHFGGCSQNSKSSKHSGGLWGLCRNQCTPIVPATSCPTGAGHLRHLNPDTTPNAAPNNQAEGSPGPPLGASDVGLPCPLSTPFRRQPASMAHHMAPHSSTAVPRRKVLLQATHTTTSLRASACPGTVSQCHSHKTELSLSPTL